MIEAEVASRDASNTAARLNAATFRVIKTVERFDVAASSIPAPTWAYLTSLEWIPARENLALIGPAGTGKSHTIIALGLAAVHAGCQVKSTAAADLVETLYRGLADNSVGKTIETLLHHDVLLVDEVGFAPSDDTGAQLLFRLVAAAYERGEIGLASHWSFEDGGRFLPEDTTAVSPLDRLLHHATTVVTTGQAYRTRESKTRTGDRPTNWETPQGWGLVVGHQRDHDLAVDNKLVRQSQSPGFAALPVTAGCTTPAHRDRRSPSHATWRHLVRAISQA